MVTLTEKIYRSQIGQNVSDLVSRVRQNPKKTALAAAAAGLLISTTLIEDNVHFGSTTLNNPQGNHYVWGIAPTTSIIGSIGNANISTYGLIYANNEIVSKQIVYFGNLSSYGLLISNNVLDNLIFSGNLTSIGAYNGLYVDKNTSITGNINYRGLSNELNDNIHLGVINLKDLKDFKLSNK